MGEIQVQGKTTLQGEIKVQGSKNGVLPILAATVLVSGVTCIENCPKIIDVEHMLRLLSDIGCLVSRKQDFVYVDATHITKTRLPKEEVESMRSSILFLGALISRCGEATLSYPGGCVIGERPIDIHVAALSRLGVEFEQNMGYLTGYTTKLTGNRIRLRFPSVGATENALLASVLAKGSTTIDNCATEPEIQALCLFLNKAGAKITGIGTDCLSIEGVSGLQPVTVQMEADRIVAGTYLLSTVAAGGEITILNAPVMQMASVISIVKRMGAEVQTHEDYGLRVLADTRKKSLSYIRTGVYPGFPTDLQSLLMVALTGAEGESILEERIFENRFHIKGELQKMGADIVSDESIALIRGPRRLKGCRVSARDLRGGAALILAGICAQGTTIVENSHFIERGYEDICRDFSLLGAKVNMVR